MKNSGVGLCALLMGVLSCNANAQRDQRAEPPARTPLPDCEWCGAPEAPAVLTATMQTVGPNEPGTRLTVQGTVFYADSATPAAGVLIYAYHTNAAGAYPRQAEQPGNGRRHGALRGWLRTDSDGHYRIQAIQPGSYPGRVDPAHIHMTVTPPGGEEWYIDEIEFESDPRLTPAIRARREHRGGRGIVQLRDSAGQYMVTRNIVLPQRPPMNGNSIDQPHDNFRLVSHPVTHVDARSLTDTLNINVHASVIRWKGTKFRGRGSHEGTVRLAAGQVYRCGITVCGGGFAIDMTSINVTDIPLTDPVPRRRLTEHLKSADFFWTERYPDAQFTMTHATSDPASRGRQYRVRGLLTLRDQTAEVRFPATVTTCGTNSCIDAHLMIDRRRWGITYRFDPIRNLVVDDSIAIDLQVVVPGSHAPY